VIPKKLYRVIIRTVFKERNRVVITVEELISLKIKSRLRKVAKCVILSP
jgi:hypothetical protein